MKRAGKKTKGSRGWEGAEGGYRKSFSGTLCSLKRGYGIGPNILEVKYDMGRVNLPKGPTQNSSTHSSLKTGWAIALEFY